MSTCPMPPRPGAATSWAATMPGWRRGSGPTPSRCGRPTRLPLLFVGHSKPTSMGKTLSWRCSRRRREPYRSTGRAIKDLRSRVYTDGTREQGEAGDCGSTPVQWPGSITDGSWWIPGSWIGRGHPTAWLSPFPPWRPSFSMVFERQCPSRTTAELKNPESKKSVTSDKRLEIERMLLLYSGHTPSMAPHTGPWEETSYDDTTDRL